MVEALRRGRIDGTLRQPWRGQPIGTPWAAAVRVELDDHGRRVATFAASVDGAGFALQDGVVLPAGDGDGPFEAAMTEAVRRLSKFCGLFRGNTRLLGSRVTSGLPQGRIVADSGVQASAPNQALQWTGAAKPAPVH